MDKGDCHTNNVCVPQCKSGVPPQSFPSITGQPPKRPGSQSVFSIWLHRKGGYCVQVAVSTTPPMVGLS